MKGPIVLFAAIFFILFASCKQSETIAILPISTFESPFPKNNKLLTEIFGNEILIKSDGDTLRFKIVSNKNNNLITRENGDTVFYGKVCKYREFYYLNNKLNDSSYYLSALKIKGNLIYGLNPWSQYYDVDNAILNGEYRKYIKSINSDTTTIKLRINKPEMKKLFNTILVKYSPDTILNKNCKRQELSKKIISNEIIENKNEFFFKVYPNPARELINVTVKDFSYYNLFDGNRKIILQGNLTEFENSIDIRKQKPGLYFLEVINNEKTKKQVVKVVIQ